MQVLSSTVADELETTPEDPFKLVKTPTKSHILVFFFSDSSTLVCVVGGGEELVCTGDPDRYLNARIDLSHASDAVSFVHETASSKFISGNEARWSFIHASVRSK
jgi:hypothetical protein